MNTPATPRPRRSRAELAAELSQELVHLRDALVTLSLCLKDWQFELDRNGSQTAKKALDQALEKVRLQPPSPVPSRESSKPSTSEKT